MDSPSELDHHHKTYPFTLPTPGMRIVSSWSGTEYVIGPKMGGGNFGHVYECEDEWGNPQVAKVLKPRTTWQETEIKASDEAMAMAIARCPYIVHVYDTFVFQGGYYLVTERCHNTVADLLSDTTLEPLVWFEALARAVLNALHWMHTHGIAHCDIHARNVFLRFIPDALAPHEIMQSAIAFKVGDLGLSRPIGEVRPGGTFLKAACPPETLCPNELGTPDHRVDLYQAGLLFLQFLTREMLDFSQADVLAGRPRERAEALNSPWGDFISTLLRRHVDKRPATALDAWRAFRQLPIPN